MATFNRVTPKPKVAYADFILNGIRYRIIKTQSTKYPLSLEYWADGEWVLAKLAIVAKLAINALYKQRISKEHPYA